MRTKDELIEQGINKTVEELDDAFCEEFYEAFTFDNAGDEMWTDMMTHSAFNIALRVMGWKDENEFEEETGVCFADVESHYWMVCGNPSRVFTR